MLAMKAYPKEYVDACKARVAANLKAYRKQVGTTPTKDFEARYFADQVLLLDHMFVHRMSTLEGKDGNPLNEVRVLCNSLLYNDGKVQVEALLGWPNSARTGLKMSPETSVLRSKPGDPVRIDEAGFVRLSKAFFAELEKKFT
jgi:hypothetical protein